MSMVMQTGHACQLVDNGWLVWRRDAQCKVPFQALLPCPSPSEEHWLLSKYISMSHSHLIACGTKCAASIQKDDTLADMRDWALCHDVQASLCISTPVNAAAALFDRSEPACANATALTRRPATAAIFSDHCVSSMALICRRVVGTASVVTPRATILSRRPFSKALQMPMISDRWEVAASHVGFSWMLCQ